MTVGQALDLATARLLGHGVRDAARDAELLLRHVLGWDRARVLTGGNEVLPQGAESRFINLVAARGRRHPLQHLIGTQAFWRHDFVVGPAVLIPRPETEVLVEAALEMLRAVASPRIVDVGTGSGCIALSLAAERRDALVVATDLSAAALAVARENASRLGLSGRVGFVRGDLLAAFRPPRQGRGFDLVVSNPPYIGEAEWRDLAPEVRDHDPRSALVPEEGVAALYGRLLAGAAAVLRPGGIVALEIGAGQAASALALAMAAGFDTPRALPDLQQIPRVITATWAPETPNAP